jgi:hypothetical protein
MALAQSCKNTSTFLCRHPDTSIANGGNWWVGCWSRYLHSLVWATSKVMNLWVAQNQGSKFVHVGLAMTTSDYGANVFFNEHNVDLSTKGVEHGWIIDQQYSTL